MRLRDISMLVASLSLPVLAGASLLNALRPDAPAPVALSVEWPKPGTPEPVTTQLDDRFRVIPLQANDSGTTTFAVQRRAENPLQPGQPRWTLTFYSLTPGEREESRLKYLGSRCVEYDMGPDEIVFDVKHWSPDDFRKAYDEARARAAGKSAKDD